MAKIEEKWKNTAKTRKNSPGGRYRRPKLGRLCSKMWLKRSLYNRLAAVKINSRFNPDFDSERNKGIARPQLCNVCAKATATASWMPFLITDAEELAHPAALFKHLTEMENGRYAGHIHRSGDDGCSGVQDIIDKHQIKPGALVCLTMDPEMADNVTLEGSHNHLMLYAGKDKSGEHCFTDLTMILKTAN